MTRIEIWAPRWHDRKVLIACHKVGVSNEIVFTKAPTLKGIYTIKGSEVEKYPKESNGVLDCFAVPLDQLRSKDEQQKKESHKEDSGVVALRLDI
jgi:hypothetical protein